MAIFNTYDASIHINRHHIRFADKCCTPIHNPTAYTELMRAMDFLRTEKAAKSIVFPAVLFDGTRTVIELKLIGNDEWEYIERPAEIHSILPYNRPV